MIAINNSITTIKQIRYSAACLVLVAAVVFPVQSRAGWFDHIKSAVHAKAHTATTKVDAAPGNAKNRMEDLARKVNEIYSTIEEHRPLLNKIRDGRMLNTVKQTLDFIQDTQAGYQQFADQGVYAFRSDMKNLIANFSTIGASLGQNGPVLQRLQKIKSLVDKMPTAFLYVMHDAIGPALSELRTQTSAISNRIGILATLPNLDQVYLNPTYYAPQICPLVTDRQTVVSVAVLQAHLRVLSFRLKTIKDLLPSDLVVTADVVAGGGLTLTKNPEPVPFQIMQTIVDAINLKIANYQSIAQAVCSK